MQPRTEQAFQAYTICFEGSQFMDTGLPSWSTAPSRCLDHEKRTCRCIAALYIRTLIQGKPSYSERWVMALNSDRLVSWQLERIIGFARRLGQSHEEQLLPGWTWSSCWGYSTHVRAACADNKRTTMIVRIVLTSLVLAKAVSIVLKRRNASQKQEVAFLSRLGSWLCCVATSSSFSRNGIVRICCMVIRDKKTDSIFASRLSFPTYILLRVSRQLRSNPIVTTSVTSLIVRHWTSLVVGTGSIITALFIDSIPSCIVVKRASQCREDCNNLANNIESKYCAHPIFYVMEIRGL